MVQKEYLRTQKKPRVRFPSLQKEELWIAAAALFLHMFFSCQWQKGQMNSNEGGYTAMWQQQRRDTMAYEDRLQTSLLYRILEDQRNPRCRFPKCSEGGALDCCCPHFLWKSFLLSVAKRTDKQQFSGMFWRRPTMAKSFCPMMTI